MRVLECFVSAGRQGLGCTMKRLSPPSQTGDQTMLGLMQERSLLISSLIDFAEKHHGDSEVVSRRVEGDIHRSDWAQVARRSR